LAIGLTGAPTGHLSGVAGAAFVGVRLQVVDGGLRMEFQSKAAGDAAPNFSKPGPALMTTEGHWYHLKLTFSRVDAENVRATAVLSNATETGEIGSAVGFFGPTNFGLPGFKVKEIAGASQVWAALRANGAGGVDALDDFQIVANSASPDQTTSTR
jgi:hypothetical protein